MTGRIEPLPSQEAVDPEDGRDEERCLAQREAETQLDARSQRGLPTDPKTGNMTWSAGVMLGFYIPFLDFN